MVKKYIPMILVIGWCLSLLGCTELGKVDQGRVIAYDKEKGLVTMIRDVKHEARNPDYNHLPPVTYQIPSDPSEMGAEPKAGLRMKLDTKNKQIVIFDPVSKNFKTIDYSQIDEQDNIDKNHPLVMDAETGKAKKFPVVDRNKKQITVYSARQKILTTFTLPDEYFSLPDATWDAGDEVRIYYKEEGKARRLMNISKTDIYKK
jgi:hypothetical protein